MNTLARLSALAVFLPLLASCVDVAVDVELTGSETARATMTQVMNADFYTLIKLNEDAAAKTETTEDDPATTFCAEGDLTESIDGSATCVLVEEGAFADLDLGQDRSGIIFSEEAPGLVLIAIATDELTADAVVGEELDAETAELVDAFFTGRTITISFSGDEVVDTNMTLSEDEKSASRTIALLDLMNGTADLPDEVYAVVRAP